MNRQADWTATPQGADKYQKARAYAQARANATGFDYGIERNNLFREYRVFMLPGKAHRTGHELRCEVVSCDDPSRVQQGHGP